MPSRDTQADRLRNIALTCFCATVIPLPLGVLLEGANVLHEGDTVRLGLPLAAVGFVGHLGVLAALLRRVRTDAAERRHALRRIFWTGGLGLLLVTLELSSRLAKVAPPPQERVGRETGDG